MRKWPEGSITLLIEKGFRSSKLKAKDELVTLSPIFPNTTYIFFLPTCTYIILVANLLFYWRRRRKSRFVFKLLDPFNLKNIFLFKTAKKMSLGAHSTVIFHFVVLHKKMRPFAVYIYPLSSPPPPPPGLGFECKCSHKWHEPISQPRICHVLLLTKLI